MILRYCSNVAGLHFCNVAATSLQRRKLYYMQYHSNIAATSRVRYARNVAATLLQRCRNIAGQRCCNVAACSQIYVAAMLQSNIAATYL